MAPQNNLQAEQHKHTEALVLGLADAVFRYVCVRVCVCTLPALLLCCCCRLLHQVALLHHPSDLRQLLQETGLLIGRHALRPETKGQTGSLRGGRSLIPEWLRPPVRTVVRVGNDALHHQLRFSQFLLQLSQLKVGWVGSVKDICEIV